MSKPGFMIGALLNLPSADLSLRVYRAMEARGFGDVPPAQRVVMQLLHLEGNRVTDLAARAGMTKQSMAYLVARLESAGYLERVPDTRDGRASLVRRTEHGWAYARAAASAVAELEDEWARLMGAARMRQLKSLLLELVTALGHTYEGSVAQEAVRQAGHASSRLRPGGAMRAKSEADRQP